MKLKLLYFYYRISFTKSDEKIYINLFKFIEMINKDDFVGLKIKTYTFIRLLGAGAWAKVYEVFDQKTKNTFACKILPMKVMSDTPKLKELVDNQIKVLQRCNNENVIRFKQALTDQKNIFIFTEFCNGGDLENYLLKKKKLDEDQAIYFLKQILNGFKGLHEVNAMHRDFKCANVLLHNDVAKIADLGFAKILKNQLVTNTILGTCVTMAPELLQNKTYGDKCDIWSVGVVYYQLLMGDYPYSGMNDLDILKKIKKERPRFPQNIRISEQSKDFINKCLTIDVTKRIDWSDIYEHPLFVEKKNNYRKTYLGQLNSNVIFGDNKNFYKNQKKDKIKLNDGKSIEYQKMMIQKNNDIQKLQEEIKKKKEKERNILVYSGVYLERRNYIMLSLKYGISLIYELINLPIQHNLYAFIIAKKTVMRFRELKKYMIQKVNVFQFKNYVNEFFESLEFKKILQGITSDYQTAKLYAETFLSQIKTNELNPTLQKQMNLNQLTDKFGIIFNEELKSYANQLFNQKQNKNIKKKSLLKLVMFLSDLRDGIKITSEEYDRKMDNFDEKKFEIEYLNRTYHHK